MTGEFRGAGRSHQRRTEQESDIEVAPPGSATSIALIAAKEGMPAAVETGIRLMAEDAPALHAELLARGVDVGELLRWPGVPPMFAFRDQDGNGLEIVG
ncbi:MAG TPA: hypothetical protein VGN41_17470 [Streptosporangiaceae bacterium]|jgi:hypothetical protein